MRKTTTTRKAATAATPKGGLSFAPIATAKPAKAKAEAEILDLEGLVGLMAHVRANDVGGAKGYVLTLDDDGQPVAFWLEYLPKSFLREESTWVELSAGSAKLYVSKETSALGRGIPVYPGLQLRKFDDKVRNGKPIRSGRHDLTFDAQQALKPLPQSAIDAEFVKEFTEAYADLIGSVAVK